jgi:hypothetical protein
VDSETLRKIQSLVAVGEVRISEHGYDELAEDDITVMEVVSGAASAEVVEDYPEFPKGSSVLVLQADSAGRPIHVVWGIPKGYMGPAVLVTA